MTPIDQYLGGASLAAIAKMTGRSKTSIWKKLTEAGIPLRRRGSAAVPDAVKSQFEPLALQGLTHAQIAEKLGVAKHTVHIHLKQLLPNQRRGPRVYFDAQGNRLCKGCQQWLPREHFLAEGSAKTRQRGICRECLRFKNRAKTYGITQVAYLEKFQAQKGACAICRQIHVPSAARPDLCVDHCHTTGAVRGLLCHKCNLMLGLSKDSQLLLQSAIQYLGEYHVTAP